MPSYKAFKDQIFEITGINIRVDSFESKTPQIEKVEIHVSERDNPVTINLTKKVKKKETVVDDGVEIPRTTEEKINMPFNELAEILKDIAEETQQDHQTVQVKGTVTKGIPDDEDKEPFYFINQNHLGTLKILESDEDTDDSEDENMPEDVKEIVEETREEKKKEVFN